MSWSSIAAAQVIRAAKDREFHSLGLVLGYQYNGSPVIVEDGTPPLPKGQDYEQTARPGARLPHHWLPDGRPSMIDWETGCRSFGSAMTLM
jgi:hypothetical protein